jgi:LysM repeat protein
VALSEQEFGQLLAFLYALTSPSVEQLLYMIPESVPSGLPVSDFYVASVPLTSDQPTLSPALTPTLALTTPVVTETLVSELGAATPVPGAIEYEVQAGDWIFSIAAEFGVDPEEIIELNDLTSPDQFQPGLVLHIPPPTTATSAPPPAPRSPGKGATIHIVKPGEWIWRIARIYGVDPQAIIEANRLTHPGMIYPGQRLIIP